MRQFDVYKNLNTETQDYAPYLIVLQSDVLDPIATCVVAPLIKETEFKAITKLNPIVNIESKKYIISIGELAGISKASLKDHVCNLETKRYEIVAALDLLFLGI